MSIQLTNPETGKTISVDTDALSLDGYVRYVLAQGFEVPDQFLPKGDADDDHKSERTIKGEVVPDTKSRAVQYTPGGNPIYGSINTAENAIRVLYEEKMARARIEQPALFPPNPAERVPGPAERARDAKWIPPHRRENYAENAWSANKLRTGQAHIDKRVNLSAIVRDRSVQERFRMTDIQLNVVQILMQVSMEKAAIKATEVIRDNGFRVLVIADMNSLSKAAARAALYRAANEVGTHLRAREVPMVYLPGSTLVSMLPRAEHVSEDDFFTWELTGPGREFTTLAAVWVLIQEYGPHETAARFGADYGFLRIMITTIERKTERAETLVPGFQYHSGRRSDAWTTMTRNPTNYLAELSDIDIGCSAVTLATGTTVASAPVVDGNWALVPYHVLKTPGGRFGREIIEKADVKRVSRDLYAVALRAHGPTVGASTRPPIVGESVRLRLIDTEADGRPAHALVTCPGLVTKTDLHTHVIGVEAAAGASGSLYIADSDGAVVGVHDGAGPEGARMVPLVADLNAVLNSPVSWYTGGGPTRSRVLSPTVRGWARNRLCRSVWTDFTQRLGSYGTVMTILDGSVVRAASPLTESMREDGWRLCATEATPLSRVYRTERDAVDPVSRLCTRTGLEGEAVVVVCFDDNGAYISTEIPLGAETSLCSENMWWVTQLRRGALLVAVKDLRVVGTMSPITYSSDWMTYRVGATTDVNGETSDLSGAGVVFGPDQRTNREWLQQVFPFLNVQTYRTDSFDECFTHTSCGSYLYSQFVFSGYQNLARVGDAIMKARFHVLLRRNGVDPQKTTHIVGQWQNNEVQAVIADQIGLTDQLRRASRLVTIGRHGLADALEALVALVYFHEDEIILDKFLRSIVMFGDN